MPDTERGTDSLQLLIIEQRIIIDRLGKVVINYKKLGKDKFTAIKTRLRIEDLRQLWTQCTKLHVQITQTATAEQQKTEEYFTKEEFQEASSSYTSQLDTLSEFLAQQEVSSTAPIHDSSLMPEHSSLAIALPKIQLPKFSGNPLEWESFRDIFSSLIVKNASLTKAQRLHYLKSAVSGSASRLIEHLSISDANFDGAWAILAKEFENQRLQIHAYLQAFFDLPVMRNENQLELKQLRDVTSSSLSALKNMKRPVEHWDDLLVFVISQKFSSRTRQEWNLYLGASTEAPTYEKLTAFLNQRIRGLTDFTVDNSKVKPIYTNKKTSASVHNTVYNSVNSNKIACPVCSQAHPIWKCNVFKMQNLDNKFQTVKQHKLCFNCLRMGHNPSNCPSTSRCFKCQRAHHTFLHRDGRNLTERVPSQGNSNPSASSNVSHQSVPLDNRSEQNSSISSPAAVLSVAPASQSAATCLSTAENRATILLPTALVMLRTVEGRVLRVRALLDQGSIFSFVSESLAQLLRTQRHRSDLHITGFGEHYAGSVKSRVSLTIEPCHGQGPRIPMTAYVFPKLTAYTTSQPRKMGSWPHLHNLELADPHLDSRDIIHLLIGADLYGQILLNDIRQGPCGTPTGQLTIFGWILSGPINQTEASCSSISVMNCVVTSESSDSLLRKFWELEEISSKKLLSEEDLRCETHFAETHERADCGRYVVKLPFRDDLPQIGNSLHTSKILYDKLERRLQRDSSLAQAYNEFLSEYESLGHMTQVDTPDENVHTALYIPHHPVIREQSTTTRLRVVFNASHKTSNGTSLNDHLLSGPKLQEELPGVIIRWRLGRLAYTADIEKMFRQILVQESDRDYQRVLWRSSMDQAISSYRLNTVTYGTASAPYLALRVLNQLVDDDGHLFPAAIPVLQQCKYVDDVLFSGDNISTMIEIYKQLNALLARGGFHLRKWASNSPDLLKIIPEGQHETALSRSMGDQDSLKVLGLVWIPSEDYFKFKLCVDTTMPTTKRTILSFLARLYDPLGWAAPVTICAKIFMQDLWLSKVEWDDPIPSDLLPTWSKYFSQFHQLDEIRIPRWIGYVSNGVGYEIHGFADASSRAYSAVVYLRILHHSDENQVRLITAKTKVAPVKTISIPRLELLAVVLLAKLLEYTANNLNLSPIPIYGWTDSTVVLAWLKQHPSRWTTFVANRVSDVQTRLPEAHWNHVPTSTNSADCASRGISADELRTHSLWWTGPPWLHQPSPSWPTQPQSSEETRSLARSELAKTHVCQVSPTTEWDLPFRVSSWLKLLRVTAYLVRFVRYKFFPNTPARKVLRLTSEDLLEARNVLCRSVQRQTFRAEITQLTSRQSLPSSSCLRNLHPFIGKDELLRLGGRLRHASLPYEARFPIILPKHRVSQLLLEHAHRRTLHGGTQLTLSNLRQNYWVIGARSLTKTIIHSCIPCVRERASSPEQLMGDLPKARVTPSPPFSHTGVDYAGPMSILAAAGRGQRPRKYYVSLFVCLATKAVHLEYVEDYTSAGFLAAYRRFVSRRGVPSDLYSDNGTNFQGADHELQHSFKLVCKDSVLHNQLRDNGTTWHFIPAIAPHFGGLWEAAVKSFKHHLRRVVGSYSLTQLEFSTLLCQIEACLNSRPLVPLKDDPSDLDVLTPSHFLIGRPILSLPEPSLLDCNPDRLTRWYRVQSMRDHFWKAWLTDYLQTMHQRYKWQKTSPNLQVGELVLLRNNLLPPSKWDLARVTEVHSGSDGLVRVATLRTAKTIVKRPISQLCRLPVKST